MGNKLIINGIDFCQILDHERLLLHHKIDAMCHRIRKHADAIYFLKECGLSMIDRSEVPFIVQVPDQYRDIVIESRIRRESNKTAANHGKP